MHVIENISKLEMMVIVCGKITSHEIIYVWSEIVVIIVNDPAGIEGLYYV